MEPTISIDGETFTLIRVQRDGASGVYRGNDEYLRIGERAIIHRHLTIHKQMEAIGFPVPKLLSEGEHEGKSYFIEKSVGELRLGDAFSEDWNQRGVISDEHFGQFMQIVELYIKAQLKADRAEPSRIHLSHGVRLDTLCDELPEHALSIRETFKDVFARISVFPGVLTHGDFNPQNLYEGGVIDLEDAFYAPVGYDPVCALTTINFFPDSKEYEYFARYRFSEAQKRQYMETVDVLFTKAKLPRLSEYAEDFEFCRGIWCAVKMQKWPKLQKWRYNEFIRRFI